MVQPIDILILSNGPGELTTWVRPVVVALRNQLKNQAENVRISLILSPCPHATGKEVAIANSYPEIDRVQSAEYFWQFLLSGKTADSWDWSPQGVVLFLGGDQFFTVIIAKRLGYRSVIYAEWDARWWRWIDVFGVMNHQVIEAVPRQYLPKFQVIGDLMADVQLRQNQPLDFNFIKDQNLELIGLLPGSKPAKLAQGVPFTLAIAQYLHEQRPQTRFVIPVAPTLDLSTLAQFANPKFNPILTKIGNFNAVLKHDNPPYFQLASGLKIYLYTETPAYGLLSQCRLCLTTIGANTAELGSLGVPMIVLLPTQQLDAMRAWDGIPGLLANFPLMGSLFAKTINGFVLQQGKRFAWPNIWAKTEIVPELVGKLEAKTVAEFALDYLQHPEKLQQMRDRLVQVRGEPGAAEKLAEIILRFQFEEFLLH
ncbi:MAG: lipid-A-disaccharide synthase [Cyanobacteria bacterium J06592_8]